MPEPLRVLIVDDDPNMTTTLKDILTASGYEVETARRAQEALHRFARRSFGCVISDIRMPGMNGVELQQAVTARYGRVPFLFISAYAANELYEQARRQGALGFLEKPLNLPVLLTAMKVLSSQRDDSHDLTPPLPLW